MPEIRVSFIFFFSCQMHQLAENLLRSCNFPLYSLMTIFSVQCCNIISLSVCSLLWQQTKLLGSKGRSGSEFLMTSSWQLFLFETSFFSPLDLQLGSLLKDSRSQRLWQHLIKFSPEQLNETLCLLVIDTSLTSLKGKLEGVYKIVHLSPGLLVLLTSW